MVHLTYFTMKYIVHCLQLTVCLNDQSSLVRVLHTEVLKTVTGNR